MKHLILAALGAASLLAACAPAAPTTPSPSTSATPSAMPSTGASTMPGAASPSASVAPAASTAPLAVGTIRLTNSGSLVTTPSALYAGRYSFDDRSIAWLAQVTEFKSFHNVGLTILGKKELTSGFTVADLTTVAISVVQYDAAGTVVEEWAYPLEALKGLTLDSTTGSVKGRWVGVIQKAEFDKDGPMNATLEFNLPYPTKSSK